MTYAENGMPAKNPLSAQIDLSKFSTDDFVPASAEEKAQQEVMGESVSFFKDGLRRLMRNKLAMGSIIVLLVMVVAIIILPMIIPFMYVVAYGIRCLASAAFRKDERLGNAIIFCAAIFVLVLALIVYKKIVFTKYYFNFINLIKSDWKTFFHF